MYLHQQNHFYGVSLFSPSGPATTIHNFSQYLALMQLISKIQTRSFEFSDSTGIFPPPKSLLWRMFLFWTCYYNSQFQSVSGSDAADLKNNLTQTRSFEFSDSTEIGIPFSPKSRSSRSRSQIGHGVKGVK